MGRVVILEGPDGGGKTNLARYFEKRGFQYLHEGPPTEGIDLIEYYLCKLNFAIESSANYVFDRLYLGEHVYGPIMRKSDRVTKHGLKLFNRILTSKPVTQVICYPRIDILETNYSKKMREEDDYVKGWANFKAVCSAYQNVISPTDVVFDYTQTHYLTLFAEIKKTRPYLPKGTIGSQAAKFLFVGDTPNHSFVDIPFFSLSGSSGYFNRALELAGVKEEDLAISNAYAPDTRAHDLSEVVWSLPNLKKIIFMGAKANHQRGDVKEIDSVSVPHPSYLKRFKGHNPQIMADIITRIL